jgi:hypothetical protein
MAISGFNPGIGGSSLNYESKTLGGGDPNAYGAHRLTNTVIAAVYAEEAYRKNVIEKDISEQAKGKLAADNSLEKIKEVMDRKSEIDSQAALDEITDVVSKFTPTSTVKESYAPNSTEPRSIVEKLAKIKEDLEETSNSRDTSPDATLEHIENILKS